MAQKVKKLSGAALKSRAAKIRLLAMDVDGVLTAGDIIVLDSGEEVKLWSVKDRIGFFMLKKLDRRFILCWITGRKSPQVAARAAEIGVEDLYQNADHKGLALEETMNRHGLTREQTLFIGDDWVDLPALRAAGLAVCPADAHPAVKDACHWVTAAPGGRGVFREVADTVLQAQGLWQGLLQSFENPSRRPNP